MSRRPAAAQAERNFTFDVGAVERAIGDAHVEGVGPDAVAVARSA